MDSKDFRYINALFDVLHDYTYSPIVICTQSLETEEYIQKKFNDLNVHFVSILEIVEVDKVDGVIALIDIEKVEENSTAQEWLSTLIDRCRENKCPILLTSHKKDKEMQIKDKLRARLLSGIYTEQ
ncbi:MAG: hypothetical protein IKJ13_01890 [Clostridia bacterium]|nr:hypothetical protein [Clostridia bacterium]